MTKYEYDARNRLTKTTDAAGHATLYEYDLDNNRTAVTDPDGKRTEFVYDARGRLLSETDPLQHTTFYSYNAADELTQKIDRDGRVTRNTYDDRGWVMTVDNAGTPGTPHVVLTYTYDPAGNVVSVADTIDGVAAGVNAYTYDELNRMTEVTQSGPGVTNKWVDFGYNPLGQFDTITRYSDLAGTHVVAGSSYGYDNLNRLTSLTHSNAIGGMLAFENIAYDAASRITQIQNADGTTGYRYDPTDQLTGATHGGTGGSDESYTYDFNGNRTSAGGARPTKSAPTTNSCRT